jgi:hypothetical protein
MKHLSPKGGASDPSYLVPDSKVWNKIPAASRTGQVGRRMLQFDALAIRIQRMHFLQLAIASGAILGFIFSFELFAHWLEGSAPVLLISLFCLCVAIYVVHGLESRITQMAFLSARTIAEILRIRFYLDASGEPFPTEESVPPRYGPLLGGVLQVLQTVYAPLKNLPPATLSETDVRATWFQDQLNYFKKASARNQRHAKVWEGISTIGFAASAVSLLGLLGLVLGGQSQSAMAKALLVLAPTLLAFAAIAKFYLERRGFKAIAERFEHCQHMFPPDKTHDWDVVVRDVGAQALHEIIDWYVASMEREICVPLG